MILKVTCPSCAKAYRLSPPYPPAGKRYRCSCQSIITVSYPPGIHRMISDAGQSQPPLPEAAIATPKLTSKPSKPEDPGFEAGSEVKQSDRYDETGTEAPSSTQDTAQADFSSTGEEVDRLLWTETFEYPQDLLRTAPTSPEAPAAPKENLAATDLGQTQQSQLLATQEGRSGIHPQGPPPQVDLPKENLAASEALRETRGPGEGFYDSLPPPPEPSRELEAHYLKETMSPSTAPQASKAAPTPPPKAPTKPKAAERPKADARPKAAKPPKAPSPSEKASKPKASSSRAKVVSFPKAGSKQPLFGKPKVTPPGDGGETIPPNKSATGGDGQGPPPKSRKIWLWLGAAILLIGLAGVGTVAGVVLHYSEDLPSVDSLSEYKPPEVSRVYSSDGEIIGEYFEEYREVVSYDEIPKNLRNAFLSAEDANFFRHGGIDYIGVVRAFFVNVQEGRMAQGASTITQQVARSFLLTREKKLARKIREVLLAYRVEANFSKEHILYLYLNQIFLGEGAYGVKAAARIFFDKDIQDLTLGESAILAGLPQAPSAYNPVRNWPAARRRQQYVLGQMVRNEFITEEQAEAALAQEIVLVGRVNKNQGPAASFSEHVRRYLVDTYGHDAVYEGGLRIDTTVDMSLQRAAIQSVQDGVLRTDKRIGYRGPLENLEGESALRQWLGERREALRLEAWEALPGGEDKNGPSPSVPPALTVGQEVPAVFKEVHTDYAILGIDTQREAYITLKDHTWLYVPNPKRNWKRRAQDDLKAILKVGDVVPVIIEALPGHDAAKGTAKALKEASNFNSLYRVAMTQTPEVEGALFSYRLKDGAVLAMVGGYSFDSSEFNRVMQAQRQSGSTFKPFVYAAALSHPSKGFTPSTILLDAPLTMHKESSTDSDVELWKPGNYAGDYMGEVTLRTALILSRNTPTIRILDDIKVSYFYDFVQKIGFDSPLNKDLSMGLGSSSITLFELARAYSVFPSRGERVEPRFVERVIDRDGNVLEDNRNKREAKQAIEPEAAYVVASLLKDVVAMGTGTKARSLGAVAGKTGTTNDFKDAWFLGFTGEVVTGVWHGFDQPRSMGYGQAGGDAALPTWIQYMTPVMKTYPSTTIEPPPQVVYVTVDTESGLRATGTSGKSRRVAFIKGTEPKEYARAEDEVGTDDFFMMDSPF